MGTFRLEAPAAATVNLCLQIAMGTALLIGRQLARRQRFRAHGRCQAAVVLLNLAAIAVVMVPSYLRQVTPNVVHVGHDGYYTVAAVHGIAGTVAETLALYVVLVASGVRFVPPAWRFSNYRAWMRATLVVWWTVIALGIGTYVAWYSEGPHVVAAPAAPAVAAVRVHNFAFEPRELSVPAGTTVTWTDELGRHTVETADGFLSSGTLIAGGTYSKRFDTPGVYEYFCGNHGSKNGSGMTGRIVVTKR